MGEGKKLTATQRHLHNILRIKELKGMKTAREYLRILFP